MRATCTELFVMNLPLAFVDLVVVRAHTVPGLVQYQSRSKSANKEVETLAKSTMALCTQRTHLKSFHLLAQIVYLH